MKNYANLYYFYSSRILKLIRFLIFVLLTVSIVNQFLIIPQKFINFKFPFFFLSLFVIIEIFFHRKIYRKFSKMDIKKEDLVKENVSKDRLSKTAFDLVKKINGNFVTEADILIAYFITTEDKTKLLFKSKLKEDDLLRILIWARMNFEGLEKVKKTRIEFWGEGIAESWIYGWTIETKKYM